MNPAVRPEVSQQGPVPPGEPDRTPVAAPAGGPATAGFERERRVDEAGRVATVAGIVVVALLCAVVLRLVYRGGGVTAQSWLPLVVALAALGLLLSVSGPAAPTGRLRKVILSLLGAQVVWTTASILWATSAGNAWEEINRTLFYALGATLAFVAVRWAGRVGMGALALLLVGTVSVIALVLLGRLAIAEDFAELFVSGRLNYPVTYFNALAALLMVGFWLAMGVANATGARPAQKRSGAIVVRARRWFPLWTQPLLLALAVLMLELALLPQSRGALWTFFLTLPFFLILSPHRLRALAHLTMVALPPILFWDRFNGVYSALHEGASVDVAPTALSHALEVIGYSVLMVLAAWAVGLFVERGVGPLSRRLTVWIGTGLIVLTVLIMAGGLVYAHQRTGGLDDYLRARWTEFTGDVSPEGAQSGEGSGRFAAVDLSGRMTMWTVAAQAFREHPVLGLGAQNYDAYFHQHRPKPIETNEAHSLPLQLLAELGLPGLLLWLGFVGLAVIRGGLLRFRSSDRAMQAVTAAVLTAVISWFIHSSADWLWEVAALTLPVMMLLGALAGADEEGLPRAQSSPAGAGRAARPMAPAAVTLASGQAVSVSTAGRAGATPAAGRRRSTIIRTAAATVAVVIAVSAALPYVSFRYAAMASGIAANDSEAALAGTRLAARLDPTSTFPLAVRAGIYSAAADRRPSDDLARVEQLELAAAAWMDAIRVDPSNWLFFYKAALALAAVSDAAAAAGLDSTVVEENVASARSHLEEARRLNPLAPQVNSPAMVLNGAGAG